MPPPPLSPRSLTLQGRSTLDLLGALTPRVLSSITLCLDLNNLLSMPLEAWLYVRVVLNFHVLFCFGPAYKYVVLNNDSQFTGSLCT